MAQKGINTLVLEAKYTMVNAVKACLDAGVPDAVLSIIMDGIQKDISNNITEKVQKEKEEFEEQTKLEAQQVEYIPKEKNGLEQNEVTH